jgi:hypothetical protein
MTIGSRMHFALAAFVVTCASAQAPAPLTGKWLVKWQSAQRELEAKLVVTDTGGTWKTMVATKAKRDTCSGREVPIAVDRESESQVKVRLKFSEAIPGCVDSNLDLTIAPDGKISGTRGGASLTFLRE